MVKIYDQNNKDVREQETVRLMLYIMFTIKYKIKESVFFVQYVLCIHDLSVINHCVIAYKFLLCKYSFKVN